MIYTQPYFRKHKIARQHFAIAALALDKAGPSFGEPSSQLTNSFITARFWSYHVAQLKLVRPEPTASLWFLHFRQAPFTHSSSCSIRDIVCTTRGTRCWRPVPNASSVPDPPLANAMRPTLRALLYLVTLVHVLVINLPWVSH